METAFFRMYYNINNRTLKVFSSKFNNFSYFLIFTRFFEVLRTVPASFMVVYYYKRKPFH